MDLLKSLPIIGDQIIAHERSQRLAAKRAARRLLCERAATSFSIVGGSVAAVGAAYGSVLIFRKIVSLLRGTRRNRDSLLLKELGVSDLIVGAASYKPLWRDCEPGETADRVRYEAVTSHALADDRDDTEGGAADSDGGSGGRVVRRKGRRRPRCVVTTRLRSEKMVHTPYVNGVVHVPYICYVVAEARRKFNSGTRSSATRDSIRAFLERRFVEDGLLAPDADKWMRKCVLAVLVQTVDDLELADAEKQLAQERFSPERRV